MILITIIHEQDEEEVSLTQILMTCVNSPLREGVCESAILEGGGREQVSSGRALLGLGPTEQTQR